MFLTPQRNLFHPNTAFYSLNLIFIVSYFNYRFGKLLDE